VEETVEIVNPVVKVILVVFLVAEVARLWWLSGQSVGFMDLTEDMAKLEMEGENGDDPVVNTGRGCDIGVV